MPSTAPTLPRPAADRLKALGLSIRQARLAAGVSAASGGEAAGMSRVTLTRIERGEPSVTMGAYLGLMAALGLALTVGDAALPGHRSTTAERDTSGPSDPIRIADYPQLAAVAWHVPGLEELTPEEARGIYERHWRHVDVGAIGPAEARLIRQLGLVVGAGGDAPHRV
jgi:transcriptional regulator with XRE-family HTH domain